MTPEQLDEIEKLAEAATPGRYRPEGEHPDARFVAIACNYALPLVKAVRDARQERDEARAERDEALERAKCLSAYSGERHGFYQSTDGKVSGLVPDANGPWVRACDAHAIERERDEARAEIERLKALLEKKP